MKVNTKNIDLNKSMMVGSIEIKYIDLVEIFGEPKTTSEKCSCIWDIEFDDGVVASIYDWKPEKSDTPETTTIWNIGGWHQSKQHVIDYINNVK